MSNTNTATWSYADTAGHDVHGQSVVYDEDGKDIAIVFNGDAHAALIANAPRIAAEHAELVQALRDIERLCLAASAGYGDDPDTDVAIIARNAHAALSKVEAE